MSETPSHTANTAPVAGNTAVLAERYAGALYELAEKENAVDATAADLRGLRQLWDGSTEWRAIASDPRLMQNDVVTAVEQVIKSTGVQKLTGNFIGVLAVNRRLDSLPSIITAFLNRLAASRGEHTADIRTARPLSSAQRDALTAALSATAGGKVNLTVIEDPSILGGLTIKMGSNLIDASVKTRLDLLERQLIAGAVA